MQVTAEHRAWIKNVLGISLPGALGDEARAPQPADGEGEEDVLEAAVAPAMPDGNRGGEEEEELPTPMAAAATSDGNAGGEEEEELPTPMVSPAASNGEADAGVRSFFGDVDGTLGGGPRPADTDADADTDDGDTGIKSFFGDLGAKLTSAVTGTDPRATDKQGLLARLAKMSDPAEADDKEKAALKTERDAIADALKADVPSTDKLGVARAALDRLAALIESAKRRIAVSALSKTDPEAGKAASEAFAQFDKALGGVEVTPQAMKEAAEARKAKEEELAAAQTKLKDAQKLPDTDPKKKAAVASAQKGFDGLKAEADKLVAREDAMVGLTSLTAALEHGPMSGESGAPFKPETVRKLVAAYKDDPRMADAAVKAAGTAKYPDAIADNVGPMISRAKSGFASGSGEAFGNRDYSKQYGENLLKMGGDVGPDYFTRLNDYVASGQQFTDNATGDRGAAEWSDLAQQRSVKLAGALIGPDGSIDVNGGGAKNAIGNALFHPDAMRNQTPAYTAQVMKTVNFLSDPTTGPQASNVMKGVTAPANPAAQKLIRNSTGTAATDPVDDKSARQAVLAALLKPVDQGPVGSCFATAPSRRLRETQPLDAMKSYAQIATTGTYTPPFGPTVPAVTNLAPGDDPLIGSLEYSVATSAARRANSNQATTLSQHFAAGVDELKASAVKSESGDKDKAWQKKKAKLLKDVADGFTFTYDPTATMVDSNDGHSSQGRYIVERVSNGTKINAQADFEAAVTDIALASLGMDPKSPDAADVKKVVSSKAFLDKVCPADYRPWALGGGGQTQEATQTLFGDTLSQQQMMPPGNKATNEGVRTAQVMNGFLNNFAGDPRGMATIRTVGMHGFNALPNDPSLAALKGKDPAETAQKVKTNLTDKAKTLSETDLTAERAGWMFDQAIQDEIDREKDPNAQEQLRTAAVAFRPSAPIKPPALKTAIANALDAYHDAKAQKAADDYSASGTHSQKEIDDKKKSVKAALDKRAATKATNAMIKDMGAAQFVIADSNWGDPQSHTFFVMVPDPTTGEPRLFERTDPPGSLRPAGREWVDAEWADIK